MSIKNYIDIDKEYNVTPDLPYMRYFGSGIPVFFWDGLKDFSTLQAVLSSINVEKNYESKFYNAMTVGKYVPWYNMEDNRDSYASYCLEEYDDLVFLDLPDYTMGIPLSVQGKVVNVSLEALLELDAFYENEHIFTRQLIEVHPSQWSTTKIKAFTWFNTVDQISTFDTKTSEYTLDKNLDFTPFSTRTTQKGEEYYEL